MLLVYVPHSDYEVLQVWQSGSTNYEQLTRQPPGPAGDGLSGLEEQQRPRILSVDGMCSQRMSGDQQDWDPRYMEQWSRTQVLENKSGRENLA